MARWTRSSDEPVSALDVTVRVNVLELLADLQARHRFSRLSISHDLGVMEQIADRVVADERRADREAPKQSVRYRPALL